MLFRSAWLHDRLRIKRAGRWLLHEAIRLDGSVASLMDRRAVAAGARASATLVHVAGDATGRLGEVRSALADCPIECAASAWNGMLVVRMLAPDSASLRHAATLALNVLRQGRPLPRVWMC